MGRFSRKYKELRECGCLGYWLLRKKKQPKIRVPNTGTGAPGVATRQSTLSLNERRYGAHLNRGCDHVQDDLRRDSCKAQQQSVTITLLIQSDPPPTKRLSDEVLPRHQTRSVDPVDFIDTGCVNDGNTNGIVIFIGPDDQESSAEIEDDFIQAAFIVHLQDALQRSFTDGVESGKDWSCSIGQSHFRCRHFVLP